MLPLMRSEIEFSSCCLFLLTCFFFSHLLCRLPSQQSSKSANERRMTELLHSVNASLCDDRQSLSIKRKLKNTNLLHGKNDAPGGLMLTTRFNINCIFTGAVHMFDTRFSSTVLSGCVRTELDDGNVRMRKNGNRQLFEVGLEPLEVGIKASCKVWGQFHACSLYKWHNLRMLAQIYIHFHLVRSDRAKANRLIYW